MKRILRTSLAEAELAEIWTYVANHDFAAANRLIERIDVAIRDLARNPELGIRRDDIREDLFCKPVHRNYLIFYEVTDAEIIIARVLHMARDHFRLFRR